MGDLSPHFSRQEFACRCGCGIDNVSPNLVDALERMRERLNWRTAMDLGPRTSDGGPRERGLVIRSGCRCREHNASRDVGGKPDSAHLASRLEMCEAADLVAIISRDRYQLVRAAMEAGIKRIGIGRDFVHVDVDPAKDQEVVWLY